MASRLREKVYHTLLSLLKSMTIYFSKCRQKTKNREKKVAVKIHCDEQRFSDEKLKESKQWKENNELE
jgi:hypothetical protein